MQQNLTRREALKRGAMTVGALTWATPAMQVVGMRPAYAQETSPGAENCCIDSEGNTVKLAVLDMKYLGEDNFCPGAHTQDDSLVTCIDDVIPPDQLPDFVFIVASHQEFPFQADGSPKPAARIWFSDSVNKGSVFSIAALNAMETVLKGETWVHIFSEDPEGTLTPIEELYLQKVGFHTSCSEPLFTGDRFGSVEVIGCEPESEEELVEPAAETQELEEVQETETTETTETTEATDTTETTETTEATDTTETTEATGTTDSTETTQTTEAGGESQGSDGKPPGNSGTSQSTVPDQADPPGTGEDESGSEEETSG